MNEKRAPFLLMLLTLLLAACSGGGSGETPPLQGAKLGGPFTLTDQNGRQVSERDFEGKYRIVYFGFTYCPDVCPVDMQVIGQAMRQIEKSDAGLAKRLQPIFISVDPERDKPAVLKEYVSAFHPKTIGLTGTPEQIADVAKKHGIFFQKAEEGGASEYQMDHSRIVLLFGTKGEPLAILPHDEGADAVAAEVRRWAA
jgi:protein SCO1/2